MAVEKLSRDAMVNNVDTAMSSILGILVKLKAELHDNGYVNTVAYEIVKHLSEKAKVSGANVIPKITPKSINDSNQPVKNEGFKIDEMDTDSDTIVITADLTNTDKEAAAKMADKNGKELKIVSEIKNLRDKKKLFFELLK